MSKVAFLIVDMQKDCKENCSSHKAFDEAIEYINEISGLFRQRNLPVVIIQDIESGGPGTVGFECVDELLVSESDLSIHKLYNNAFWETELDNILKDIGVDSVIISGFAAEYCVLFTYNGAIERGYKTFLLQKGIAGVEASEVNKLQLLRSVIAYDAIEYFL